jgi:hypothetical protein
MGKVTIDYTSYDWDAIIQELSQYAIETQSFKDVNLTQSNINTLIGIFGHNYKSRNV